MGNGSYSSSVRASAFALVGMALILANCVAAEERTKVPANGQLSVQGKVIDPGGEPHGGARVLLRACSAPALVGLIDFPDVLAETTTDAEGRFNFDGVPIPATMDRTVDELRNRQRGADLVVLADGCGLSWMPLYTLENPEPVTIRLNQAASVEGIVTGEQNPLPDTEVTVTGISRIGAPFHGLLSGPEELRLYTSSVRPRMTTDASGRFRIDGLPMQCRIHLHVVHPDYQGEYIVAATGDSVPEKVLSYRLGGEMREEAILTSPLELRLARGLTLRVHVVDVQTDVPVGEGRMALYRASREWRTRVQPDGTAAITVSEPGEYSVTYLSGDYAIAFGMRQQVMLDEAHATTPLEVTLRLPDRKWLQGRVVGKGTKTGIGGVSVSWQSDRGAAGDFEYHSRTVTEPDGGFCLATVPGRGKLSLGGRGRGAFCREL